MKLLFAIFVFAGSAVCAAEAPLPAPADAAKPVQEVKAADAASSVDAHTAAASDQEAPRVPADPKTPPAPSAAVVKIDALATPLTNTYWKLVEIEDSEVRFRAGYRESHMRMLASTDRFTGQGICNRVGGGYQLEGNKLSFNPSDNMPSPCWPDGPPESALTDALRSTVSFELVDKDLFLIDEDGVRRAHYLAVPRPGERREVGK